MLAAISAMLSSTLPARPHSARYENYRYPKSFFLTHCIAHGVEHRTQIGVMLARAGCETPNLDGWEFAGAAGLWTQV